MRSGCGCLSTPSSRLELGIHRLGLSGNDFWQKVRHRHHVGNFFQRIKRLRRVATRYDKLAGVFMNFILLAASLDWIKSF
jgi:hypothetical protein